MGAERAPTRTMFSKGVTRGGGGVVVLLGTVLVAHHLAVELVHQLVDGSVQILVRLFDEDVAALDMQRDFAALPSLLLLLLFNGEQDVHIHHLVEMTRDAFQLGKHVLSQRRSHFKMMSADRQVHQGLLCRGSGKGKGKGGRGL